MAVEVIMPQMGESIFEGTITKWLKKPGDSIERDEPLFEISTDKVDAEIPSPAAGVLKEIRVEEGKTVPIQTVVAVIDSAGSQSAAKSVAAGPAEAPATPAASAKAAGSYRAAPSSPRVRLRVHKDLSHSPKRVLSGEPPRLYNKSRCRMLPRLKKLWPPRTKKKRAFPRTANAFAALRSCVASRVKTRSI